MTDSTSALQASALVSGEVNNTTLLIGPTGSGKSSLLATAALYAFNLYGAITFLYSSDGGGYPDRVAALIKRGVIRVFRMRTRNGGDDSLALETTIKASKGYWPARIDPATGVCDPNVPMVPSIVQTADGWKPNKGFPARRVVAFDGLSSMSNWWLDDLQQRAGRLEITGGEKSGGIGNIVSGTERFSGGSRSQVGFAQNRAHQVVLNAQGIPNLALPPIFTALSNEATDEGALRICGPKLAGQAKTDEAGQWVGNCLEARRVIDPNSGQSVYRLYLDEFLEHGIRHLLKNRAEAGMLPMYLQDPAPIVDDAGRVTYPGAFTEFNLGKFFALMEAAQTRALEVLDQQITDAPGLQAIEYGDPAGQGRAQVAVPGPGPVVFGPAAGPTPAATAVPPPVAAPKPIAAAPTMRAVPPPPAGAPRPAATAPVPPVPPVRPVAPAPPAPVPVSPTTTKER